MPAFLRGLVKTKRIATEGETVRTGAVIRDETWYTTAKLVGQSMGFSNTEVASVQDSTYKYRAIAAKIVKERETVYRKIDQALRTDNEAKLDAGFEALSEFNRKNWFAPITSARLLSSVTGKAQTRAEAILGLTLENAFKPWAYDIFLDDFQVRE